MAHVLAGIAYLLRDTGHPAEARPFVVLGRHGQADGFYRRSVSIEEAIGPRPELNGIRAEEHVPVQ